MPGAAGRDTVDVLVVVGVVFADVLTGSVVLVVVLGADEDFCVSVPVGGDVVLAV